MAEVKPSFCHLIWILRREFRFDPDMSASQLLSRGLDSLVQYGALTRAEENWSVADTSLMGEIYGLFRNFLESYLLVLRGVEHLPASPREYVKHLQFEGESLLLNGGITRPEALSLITLKNAVDTYQEEKVLKVTDGVLLDNLPRRTANIDALTPMVD
ncbi:MAG: hypothetical protein HN348_32990 [Proteobacteria bacterium]|nr:hypothetical protein [Pseudomonadota bacterium]